MTKTAEELGRRVLASVGTPYQGSESLLGEIVMELADGARDLCDRQVKAKHRKKIDKMRKIAAKTNALATTLATETGEEFPWHGASPLDQLKKVAMQLDARAQMLDEQAMLYRVDSLENLIGRTLVICFEDLFGHETMKFTRSTIDGKVDGPFIRFVRAILEEADIPLTDESIAKYCSGPRRSPKIPKHLRD